jgi:hypothetical protein
MTTWLTVATMACLVVGGYAAGRAHAYFLLAAQWSRVSKATIEAMDLMDKWRRKNGEVIP